MRHLLVGFFLMLFSVIMVAQDQHFTQFYSAPLTLNPALTGTFDGRYRFSTIYRDQWRKVLDNPYTTYAAAIDMRFDTKSYGTAYKDGIGIGVLFYTDRVATIDFNTTQVALSAAYHKALSTANNQFLTAGIQFGIAQRNVNLSNLYFDDQFNGRDGYTNATEEVFPQNNFAYPDFSAGVNYSYAPTRRFSFFVGGALHHFLEPEISFYFDDENPDESISEKLHSKITAHIGLSIPVGDRIQLNPRAVYTTQGGHTAINAGSNIRFAVGDVGNTALHIGSWARPVTDVDGGFQMEAVVVMAGFEINNILLGFSYDANLTDLANTRQGQGAFEVSLAYLGNYENETVLCPKF